MQTPSLVTLVKTVAVVGSLFVLSACSSVPDIYVNQDPSADFSRYNTYGFESRLGTDRDSGSQSLVSTYFRRAVSKELEARGYVYSDNPDLSVNFFVNTEEKIRSRSVPTSGGYYGYRGGYYDPWGGYGGGYETRIDQYTEGTVNIDLIDARNDQLVWEGAVVGKITKEVRENLEATVNAVATEVFAVYPYIAGSNEIQPAPQK
jgi:hypothetical protein